MTEIRYITVNKQNKPNGWKQTLNWTKSKANNWFQESLAKTQQAAEIAKENGQRWIEQTQNIIAKSEAWNQAEQSTRMVIEKASDIANSVSKQATHWQQQGAQFIEALEVIERTPEDLNAVMKAAQTAFSIIAAQLDSDADAIAIGQLREAGAGIASVQGTELLFIPADGPVRAQLRISRVIGQCARLAVGGQVSAYAAVYYGDRDSLLLPLQRRGADVGVLIASMGFFRAQNKKKSQQQQLDTVTGWMVELGAGISLGIPIISDFSAFDSEEIQVVSYPLEREQNELLDCYRQQAPSRPGRKQLAKLLTQRPWS